ncbi:hypothetical protein LRAMOSA00235 [Lichtheimia ramosa]|uniref:PROP1-like PPR domain-containing protein n=1 Tax=Lichtheimia ramosa TaxID=688394 RepID=A0A077W5Z9_9FUNG|nr:hypothetical protein LRAMOSA00235 [Lichtheimia ramosa]
MHASSNASRHSPPASLRPLYQHDWLLPCSFNSKHVARTMSGKPARRATAMSDDENPSSVVLTAALEQSASSTASTLINVMFHALRRVKNPMLAWECYNDLKARDMLHYLGRDQYKELLRLYPHHTNHTQSLDYFLEIAHDMETIGYALGRKEKLILMRLLGMNGKLEEMEQVFDDLKEGNILIVDGDTQKPFNIVLNMYQQHKNSVGVERVAAKSMQVYDQMIALGVPPSSATTRLLVENIRAWGRSYDSVETVWNWFWGKLGMNVGGKTVELDPSLYREMVLYFASAGRAEYALEVNDMMVKKGMKRDVKMITALIHKVGRSGNIDRSLELLDEMIQDEKLAPNLVTFNALIDIHAHKRPEPDLQGASRMYELLQESGLEPDITTIGPLIDMFAKHGDNDMVRRLYHDMVHERHIAPNEHIHSSLIECFINNNDSVSALDVLRVMRDKRQPAPNEEIYNLLIRSFVRRNEPAKALRLLDLMIQADIQPSAQTFVPLLGRLADEGDVTSVEKMIDSMNEIGIPWDIATDTARLEAYARAGDIEGAQKMFKQLKQKRRPNIRTFNALLYGYTGMNEMELVLDTYKQMMKTYVKMNEYTYCLLIRYFAQRKEMNAVESLLDTMRNNQVTPDVSCWTSVMQGYFHSDRYNDGIHVLERMIEDNVKPNLHTLSVLVAGSSEAGNLKLAEKVLDQGLSRIQPKIKDNSHALADVNKRALSTELYSSDLPLTIDDLLNRKAQHSIQIPPPHLFTPLIDAYANSDNFIKAKALVRDMLQLGVSFNETAYVSIMTLYQKQGAYDVVEKLWQHLHQRSADTLDMSSMDPDMQISLPLPDIEYKTTELLHMHGDSTNRFVQLLASAPPTPSASPFALSIYIDSLSSQQRIDDIQQLWSELTQQSYSFDEQNWNRYIVALAEAGLGDQACSVAVDYLEHQAPRRIQRPWDDFEASEKSNHLHARTIQALASALDLVVEGYSTYQLQAAVYDHLNIDTTSLEKD